MIEQQIRVTYKGEDHELIPISTDRFVWHLSYKSHRKGIQTTGLEPKHGLTFANNKCKEVNHMWHWGLEWWYVGRTESENDVIFNQMCSAIDFWRIDTIKSKSKWYLDPNLNPMAPCAGENPGHRYVCTLQHIPLEAIMLYKFDLGTYRRIKYGKNKKWTNRPEGQLPLLKV